MTTKKSTAATTAAANRQRVSISREDIRRQAVFWMGALAAFTGFLYLFSSILLPFVMGMVIAYFLDPVADRLERLGLSRLWATVAILGSFVLLIALALVLVIPVLVAQFNDFAVRMPTYVVRLQALAADAQTSLLPDWAKGQLGAIRQNMSGVVSEGMGFVTGLASRVWSSGMAFVDLLSLMVVTPVVAFYILLDWDRMISKVDGWIPRAHVGEVRGVVRDVDTAVAGFIRGQGSLCLILGVYYAAGLSLTGLNFGLLIGFFAGMISFVPYVGSLVGLGLGLSVALVQFWGADLWTGVGFVLAVFVSGQFIEGNILQPRLVGQSVGLHPVWLMFALYAFGSLFGFVGMMVAVPAAAVVGVLVRYALSRYLMSDIFDGASQATAPMKTFKENLT
jgi:predicted PurR-regulated permease PerM